MTSPIGRPPIYDIAAEEAVLGSIFVNPVSIATVEPFLSAADFYRESHRWIFEAMLALHHGSEPLDVLLISGELERRGRLKDVGGIASLAKLSHRMPTALHVESYARTVADHATRRRLVTRAENIAKLAYESTGSVSQMLASATSEVLAARDGQADGVALPASDLNELGDLMNHIDEIESGIMPGLEPSLPSLARIIGGWRRRVLYMLAARPGVGKSALALFEARHQARLGKHVLVMSLEMTRLEIRARLASADCGVAYHNILNGPLREGEAHEVRYALEELRGWGGELYIDEQSGLTADDVRARILRHIALHGTPDLVIIDHLHEMRFADGDAAQYVQVRSAVSSLRDLAKSADFPLILVSQLSRGVLARSDKAPNMGDLRDGGEESADAVMLLHRDDYYAAGGGDQMQIIVGKNRQGPQAVATVRYDKAINRFEELGGAPIPPPGVNGQHKEVAF